MAIIPANPRVTVDDPSAKKRAISDSVFDIDWREAPLLNLFGFGEENIRKFNIAQWPATKVEINEDGMRPWRSTVATQLNADSSTTLVVGTDEGVYFRIGDIIVTRAAADDAIIEVFRVSANTHVDAENDDLTVTRDYNGAGQGVSPVGSHVEILSRAMPENTPFTVGPQTVWEQPVNYTQIISEACEVSRTEQRASTWGLTDRMAYEISKLFADGGQAGRLAQMLQKTFYNPPGLAKQRVTRADVGSMGGFRDFVNVTTAGANMIIDLTGDDLERKHIHQIVRGARDNGGRITHLVGGSWFFEVVLDMYEDRVRYTQDSTRGGGEITMIKTPHGEVELVYDFLCPPGDVYFCNREKIGWLPYDSFFAKPIQSHSDGHVSDVVGEYTFMLANAPSHGLIENMRNQ